MNAQTLRDAASLEALQAEWWALWRRAPEATPFQSPAWLLPWWRAFAPGELAVVAVRRDGRLVGLAPLYFDHGRLLPIGIALSDYLDVLLDPAHPTAGGAIAAELAADPAWQAWEMPELADGAALWRLPAPPGCREETGVATPGAVLPLPAEIPRRQRRTVRMSFSRAARRGAVELLRAEDATLDGLLGALLRLHALRWRERGVLSDGRVARFLREAVPALHAAGLLRLYGLRIGGAMAGAYLGFLHARRAYAYIGGLDPEFSFESPGKLVIAHAISEAAREGAEEMDFLRGDEGYKFGWGCRARLNRRRVFRRVESHVPA